MDDVEKPQRPPVQETIPRIHAGRRNLLRTWAKWAIALGSAIFLYPLIRFASFQVPRKPRLLEVPAPLPLSGVHSGQDFLLFVQGTDAWAVSRTCTHLGCRINYLEDRELIECPCHQSQFTREGQRIAGPAEKDLPKFPVRLKKEADGAISAYIVEL